jgi:hypothetical protein
MIAPPSLSCTTAKHSQYRVLASLLILVYPVGVPLVYFGLLYPFRRALDPPAASEEEAVRLRDHDPDPRLKRLSFLFRSYRPSCW